MASDISDALRARVAKRAGHRCEYCLIHQDNAGFQHQVDHIISRKHGGPTSIENLALACIVCNRNKGSDIAGLGSATGEIVRLFDPRKDHWAGHFRMENGVITPISEIGEATLRLLRLNAPDRVAERLALA